MRMVLITYDYDNNTKSNHKKIICVEKLYIRYYCYYYHHFVWFFFYMYT